MSEALSLCAVARQYGWTVIVGCEENAPETIDTFVSDLAVGVGAGQFACGGLGSGDFTAKLNRILEINASNPDVPFVGKRFRC